MRQAARRHLSSRVKQIAVLAVTESLRRSSHPYRGRFTRPRNKRGERERLAVGDLEPVYDLFTITSDFVQPAEAVTQTSGVPGWPKQVGYQSFLR